MKLLRLAAWTLWFMLSWIALAHAGPIGAALGALGSFLASGTVLANLALSAILTGVKIGISLLTKAQQDNQPAGVQADVKFGGDNPISFIMGRFATPGQLEYANTWGKVRDVDNAYITHVISLGDLPMELSGLWFDDEKVTVPDMSGPPQMPQGWDIPEIESVNGNTYCWIRFRDGTQTAAEQFLLDQFGGDPERPWLSDMIGRGVPLLIATTRYNPEVVPGIPQYLMETDGIPLYDPRKDSTVGGSGTQRWNDPSTWEPSSNNIVHVYNILRGIHYDGEWIWGGQCQAWQLPLANWMAAMNVCDQAVPLAGGGTEPQFRNGCEITVDQEPATVIENILKGCNGRIAEIGGIYKVTVGAPGAAVYSFTDETIVVTEGQALDPFPGLESTYNGAQASYPEPEEKWGAKDAPAYLRPDLEVLDDGRRLVTGLQFPYTPYAVQIQRLLKAAVQDARRFRILTLVLPPEAWLLEPNDVVSWTSARNGYVEKKFIVVEIEGDSNFLQYVTLKEVDPADYSWNPATDEQPYTVGPIGPIKPAPQPITGFQVFPETITRNGRSRPTMRITFAGKMVGIQFVRVQVRFAGETDVLFSTTYPYGDPDTNADPESRVLDGVFLPDTNYEVQAILVPFSGSGIVAVWSPWLAVKTPLTYFGGNEILDGAITELKLAANAVSEAKLQVGAVTQQILADQAVSGSKIADFAVSQDKIADQAVTQAKLADQAVSIAKFANNIRPVQIGASLPATGSEGDQFYNTTDGKLYSWHNGAWTTLEVDAEVPDGSITAAKLADAAVTGAKLAAGAVTNDKIAANSIYGNRIAAGAITARELYITDFTNLVPNFLIEGAGAPSWIFSGAWSIDSTIAVSAWGTAAVFSHAVEAGTGYGNPLWSGHFAVEAEREYWATFKARVPADTGNVLVRVFWYQADKTTPASTASSIIFNGNLAASLATYTATVVAPPDAAWARLVWNVWRDTTTQPVQIGVSTFRLKANANLIVDGSITTDKLQANAVTTAKLQTGAVTADIIASGAIVAGKIAAGAVSTSELAAGAVNADKLAAGSVISDKIAANAVTTAKLQAKSVTIDKLLITKTDTIVRDPLFEDVAWWQTISAGVPFQQINTTNAFQGGFCLRKTATSSACYWDTHKTPIDPNKTYLLKLAVRAWSAGNGRFYGIWRFWDSSGNLLGYTAGTGWPGGNATASNYYWPVNQEIPLTTQWQTFAFSIGPEGQGKVPSGTSYISYGFLSNYMSDVAGHFDIGMISITEMARGELVVDGAISAVKIAAGSITSEKIGALAVTADKIAAGAIATEKIAAGAVTADKITVASLAALGITVGTADIANAAITSSKTMPLELAA